MRNNKGSIMIITLGFIVVFTLLGMASIYFAGVQNTMAEESKVSMEAFWLADGGVEYAKAKMLGAAPEEKTVQYFDEDGDVIPGRWYRMNTSPVVGVPVQSRWTIQSTGMINGIDRNILATIDYFKTPDNPIIGCEFSPSLRECVGDDVLAFGEDKDKCVGRLLEFLPKPEDICDPATQSNIFVTDPEEYFLSTGSDIYLNVIPNEGFRDITCLDVQSELQTNINIPRKSEDANATNILVVDVRTLNNHVDPNGIPDPIVPTVTFEEGIEGIVYFVGDVILDDPNIEGAVFVAGRADRIGQDCSLALNTQLAEEGKSLLDFGSLAAGGSKPRIVDWQEVASFTVEDEEEPAGD